MRDPRRKRIDLTVGADFAAGSDEYAPMMAYASCVSPPGQRHFIPDGIASPSKLVAMFGQTLYGVYIPRFLIRMG